MAEGRKSLLLLEFMFGESAEAASRNKCPASLSSIEQLGEKRDKLGINLGRLQAWPFEAWMAPSLRSGTREAQHTRRAVKQFGFCCIFSSALIPQY